MIFADQMTAIANRMRQPDMAVNAVRSQADLPYVIKDELERVVLMSLSQVVREVEDMDWQAFSSDAVQTISGGTVGPSWTTQALPTNFLRVLAANVDGQPTVPTNVASFIQLKGSRFRGQYTLLGGDILFYGTSITAILLVEPSLTTWKMQNEILPPGSDIRALDIMAKRILISDYVPEWRA